MNGLEADTQLMKDLCTWKQMPPAVVARRAGLAATTVNRPFAGTATTRISQPTLDKLRAAFPDFPGWRQEYPDQVGMHGDRPDPNERPDELVYIRQVDISFAMGDGAVIDDYPSVGLIPFNLRFIQAMTGADTANLVIATGHGDSMEPTLLRSDLIMFDTSQNRMAHGDQIWALSYADNGMVKRLRRIMTDDGARIVIMSDNPIVSDQIARPEDIHIIGKVVWVGRRM
ncbi:S24 family peptidase [soil metagenome]